MTKNYQLKTYLVDCMGYGWEELAGYRSDELVDLIGDNLADCAKFLDVSQSYLTSK